MSMDIGVGDRVEFGGPAVFVNALTPLVVGRLYTAKALWGRTGPCICHGDSPGALEVAEAPEAEGVAYCLLQFRKRPPHREALFRSLLEPTDTKEPAHEEA